MYLKLKNKEKKKKAGHISEAQIPQYNWETGEKQKRCLK